MVAEKLRPVGSTPPLSAKLMLPKPPLAVTGVKGAAAAFTVRMVEGTACAVVSVTGLTVRVKVLDDSLWHRRCLIGHRDRERCCGEQ